MAKGPKLGIWSYMYHGKLYYKITVKMSPHLSLYLQLSSRYRGDQGKRNHFFSKSSSSKTNQIRILLFFLKWSYRTFLYSYWIYQLPTYYLLNVIKFFSTPPFFGTFKNAQAKGTTHSGKRNYAFGSLEKMIGQKWYKMRTENETF